MIVLGIETSTKIGSVALSRNGKVMAEADLTGAMNHSEKLLPAIEKMMLAKKVSFTDIHRIAVSTGPGSFTGLRIGITVARTIAQMLHKEIVSIPTLDCLAAMVPASEALICPLIQAIQGQVYYALYTGSAGRECKKITDYCLVTVEKLARDLKKYPPDIIFTGEALYSLKETLRQAGPGKAGFTAPNVWRPAASWISLLGALYTPQLWGQIVPYYIRPSEAELKWGLKSRNRL
ncbi:MAG: tRNA (adenosine(37)-N6)-threonylcarbamoyltransferase complex dimerization subunit type 1 TsaB [bacterium]|nr:tRNA (adenosine(37)-N6)-threonylcarbamoyltransferase complex dimerization subunit type 1 TsaB [bacterium]MDD5353773.1 tRNA (adenosine(37)-N6)-threonylcarbamoyltransferase complex dimerization subunit type 1 TsaB [bacterium]MDD5756308.1 tRNA (adenosine(37)-N6)-threonylcarbamoyltransferase complex dimerization subunit type 1 TsaB [bacterium]